MNEHQGRTNLLVSAGVTAALLLVVVIVLGLMKLLTGF